MRRQCAHLNDLFFCGDTAQTIASGVAFRFDDLRSLFKLEGQARIAAHELNPNSRVKGLKDDVRLKEKNKKGIEGAQGRGKSAPSAAR